MVMFLLGIMVGVVALCAVALIWGEDDERVEKKWMEKERRELMDRENWKLVHERINTLRDEYQKTAKSHETSIAILTARSDSVLSYVDTSVGLHEARFHRPKESAPKSPRSDKKK